MLTFSLQSGSSGNSIYVEADGVRLLFDAGISGKTAEARMASHGRDMRRVDALIISHDHNDHVRCAGVLHRRFGLPVYLTRRTHEAIQCDLGPLNGRQLHYFTAGRTLTFGDVQVHTLPTPHDAADGVAFVVEHQGTRLGILTDLGHPFAGLRQVLPTLHAAYIESNYDPEMLRNGPYPAFLQERIRGSGGHLSNDESAELMEDLTRHWEWAALAHLSEHNNHPTIALHAVARRSSGKTKLHVAPHRACSSIMNL